MIKTEFMQLMEELDKLNEDTSSSIGYSDISKFLDSFISLGDTNIKELQDNDQDISVLLDYQRNPKHIDWSLAKLRSANKELLNSSSVDKATYMNFKDREENMQIWAYLDTQPLRGPRRFATFYLTNQFERAIDDTNSDLQKTVLDVIKQAESVGQSNDVKVQRTGSKDSLEKLSKTDLQKTDFIGHLDGREIKVEAKIKLFKAPADVEVNKHNHDADYLVVLDFFTGIDKTTMKFKTIKRPVYIYKRVDETTNSYTRLTGYNLSIELKEAFNPIAFPNNWNRFDLNNIDNN